MYSEAGYEIPIFVFNILVQNNTFPNFLHSRNKLVITCLNINWKWRMNIGLALEF